MASQRTLTSSDLARILDCTPVYIRKLTAQGTIQRARDIDGSEIMGRYNLLAIRDYVRHLRAMIKTGDAGEQQYSALRNQRLAAEAAMSELRLRQMKGESHSAADVEFCMTNMLTHFKQQVLAIPSRVARQCVGKKFKEILLILTTEIHSVLRTLSGYDPADFAAAREEYLRSRGVDTSLNGNGAPDKADGEAD